MTHGTNMSTRCGANGLNKTALPLDHHWRHCTLQHLKWLTGAFMSYQVLLAISHIVGHYFQGMIESRQYALQRLRRLRAQRTRHKDAKQTRSRCWRVHFALWLRGPGPPQCTLKKRVRQHLRRLRPKVDPPDTPSATQTSFKAQVLVNSASPTDFILSAASACGIMAPTTFRWQPTGWKMSTPVMRACTQKERCG